MTSYGLRWAWASTSFGPPPVRSGRALTDIPVSVVRPPGAEGQNFRLSNRERLPGGAVPGVVRPFPVTSTVLSLRNLHRRVRQLARARADGAAPAVAGRGLERVPVLPARRVHRAVASEPSTHGRMCVELTGRPSAVYHAMSSGSGVPAIVKRASVSRAVDEQHPVVRTEVGDVTQALDALGVLVRDHDLQAPVTEREPRFGEPRERRTRRGRGVERLRDTGARLRLPTSGRRPSCASSTAPSAARNTTTIVIAIAIPRRFDTRGTLLGVTA